MSETIEDIVREMRKLGKLDEKSTDRIPRSLMGLGLRTYADRIEKAVAKMETATPTCDKSSQVGNAAKMRDCAVASKFPHGDYEAMKNALERVASEMIYLIDAEGSRVRFQPRAILDDVEHVLKNLGGKNVE